MSDQIEITLVEDFNATPKETSDIVMSVDMMTNKPGTYGR